MYARRFRRAYFVSDFKDLEFGWQNLVCYTCPSGQDGRNFFELRVVYGNTWGWKGSGDVLEPFRHKTAGQIGCGYSGRQTAKTANDGPLCLGHRLNR